MQISNILSLLALSGALVEAVPSKRAVALTPDTIIAVAPSTASCSASADFKEECATAQQAAKAIQASFDKYKIFCPHEKAALITTMLLESGSFKYNKNHFPKPGRPGQGTRNMQMAKFNVEYAKEVFPDKASEFADDGVKALEAVSSDEYSFATAAWFYKKYCKPEIWKQVSTGTWKGFEAYTLDCIGASIDGRQEIWNKLHAQVGKGLQ